ncbi:MAG: gliding motility-associated C-terminal domain-containing protein [Bacteroidia bacterium]|nr:gliding motility-associated C-terminal domain-containing protein [Bacteroidia bacterium]
MSKVFLIYLFSLGIATVALGQNCFYTVTDIYFQNINCDPIIPICLDVPYADRNDYAIEVDGSIYTGPITPCQYDTIRNSYNLSNLTSITDPNPDFLVDSVLINGNKYSFSFVTLDDLADSMNVYDPGASWTINLISNLMDGGLSTNDYSIMWITERKSAQKIEIDLNTIIIPYGLEIEVANGLREIVINGLVTTCSDTVTAEVYCISPNVMVDTIEINQIDTMCFAMDDLRGAVVEIINICPSESGTFAMIDPIIGSSCIEVTGLDVGQDSACLVLRDDIGLTDTVIYRVFVQEPSIPLQFIAVNDTVDATVNTLITFDPTGNDQVPGVLTSLTITDPPAHGMAVANPDGTITYTPDLGYMSLNGPDTIIYEVCINSVCETATIFVSVDPPSLVVKNGFSPNNDGINDVFVIENIEFFPEHELMIFNRWGNRIYQSTAYNNDWDATWDSATDLPDGTYFYVLDIDFNGISSQRSGYMHIIR